MPFILSPEEWQNPSMSVHIIAARPSVAVYHEGVVGILEDLTKDLPSCMLRGRPATLKLRHALKATRQELSWGEPQEIGEGLDSTEATNPPRAERPQEPCSESIGWDVYTRR